MKDQNFQLPETLFGVDDSVNPVDFSANKESIQIKEWIYRYIKQVSDCSLLLEI